MLGTIGGKIDYVAGLYYFTEDNQQITENGVLSPIGFNRYTDTSLTTDSYAVYASFDFQLTDNLSLTAGGRWTEDTKDFDIVVFNPDGSPLLACVGPDGTIVNSTGAVRRGRSGRIGGQRAGREAPRRDLEAFHPARRPGLERLGTTCWPTSTSARASSRAPSTDAPTKASTVLPLEPIAARGDPGLRAGHQVRFFWTVSGA